jgi:hypothetical protein
MGGKGSGRMPGSLRGRSKLSPHVITVLQKQAEALQLRIAGASFPVIAERLGYAGPQGAYEAVKAALDRTLREPAEELRKLDQERLERMLLGLWPQATQGNQGAIDRVIKLLERRARLLGLDAPVRLAGEGGGPVTLRVVYDVAVKQQEALGDGSNSEGQG